MWPLSRQRKFGWPELIVLVVLFIAAIALLAPAINEAQNAGRKTQCKMNLAQLGKALASYQSQHGCYPPGAIYSRSTLRDDRTAQLEARGFYHTGLTLILPQLERDSFVETNFARPWYEQSVKFYSVTPYLFLCPANGQSPFLPFKNLDMENPGQLVGRADYLFCKGVTDAWCLTPGNVKPWDQIAHSDFTAVAHAERGMFDIAFPSGDEHPGGPYVVRQSMIEDGLSNTFAMGEGSKYGAGITTNGRLATRGPAITVPDNEHSTQKVPIYQAWMLPPNTSEGVERELYLGSVFGCTLEPLNQSPVTHTVIETDPRDLLNCRPSLDWDGPAGPAPGGGVHRTSNFRSAHDGGGHFLYADASVQFIDDDIDLKSYRAMSTIAGGEPVEPSGD